MTLLYHLKPRNLIGAALYPLNQLREIHPEMYQAQIAKYHGREQLLTRTIPLLNCLWNDVLFFSPVHPGAIRYGFKAVGKSWKPLTWFVIDPKKHDFTSQNTVVYHSRIKAPKGDFDLDPDQISGFDESNLMPIDELPVSVQSYYQDAVAKDEPIFPWHGLPHILHQGCINLDRLDVIEI